MGLFLIYTLKVALCMLLLFAFNKLVLSRDTFHTFNRVMWLLVAVVSLLLPLVEWHMFEIIGEGIALGMESKVIAVADMGAQVVEAATAPSNPNLFLIVRNTLIIYAIFAALLFCKLSVSYIRLFLFILPKRVVHREDEKYFALLEECRSLVGVKKSVNLVLHSEVIAPFSWMNYVAISREDLDDNGRDILIHELSHSKHGDSWDLLFADLLTIFQWFNPAAWLYKESLQQVHEYKADESVLHSGVNAKQYQLLLIRKAVGQRLYSMANSFNHSKLKNRITMMLKEKSNKWAFAKCLYALPLAFVAVTAFANSEVSTRLEEVSSVKFTQISEDNDTLGSVNEFKISKIIREAATQKEKKAVMTLQLPYNGEDVVKLNEVKKVFLKEKLIKSMSYATKDKSLFDVKITITQGDLDKKVDHILKEIKKVGALSNIQISIYSDVTKKETTTRVSVSGDSVSSFKVAKIDATNSRPVIKVTTVPKEGIVDNDTPFIKVEKMPKFQGGNITTFKSWVESKIVYPKGAEKDKIEGKVLIEFCIEKDGAVASIKVLKSPNDAMSAEVIRVLKSSPKWTAGMQSGNNVRVKFVMPVNFKLKK